MAPRPFSWFRLPPPDRAALQAKLTQAEDNLGAGGRLGHPRPRGDLSDDAGRVGAAAGSTLGEPPVGYPTHPVARVGRMNAHARLRWLEARIVTGERRITRQLKVIRQWRRRGQDTTRREQLLRAMEWLQHRWRQHRQVLLARRAQAEVDGAIIPCDRADQS